MTVLRMKYSLKMLMIGRKSYKGKKNQINLDLRPCQWMRKWNG
jgi:hypothetical protein